MGVSLMKLDDLKFYAGKHIVESKDINKGTRLILLDIIEESVSLHEVISLFPKAEAMKIVEKAKK